MQRRLVFAVVGVSMAATAVAAGFGTGIPALLVASAIVVAIAQQSLP